MKFLKENKLEEKLPKDLARAYRNNEYKERSLRGHSETIDYENAQYTEITPEEAIAYKRSGEIGNLRLLVKTMHNDLTWIEYYDDGYCNTSVDVPSDLAYNTKTGKKITNVKYMPFAHVAKIAKKIYYTDESKAKISPEKLKRRELDYSHQYTVDPDGGIYLGSYGDAISVLGNNRQSGMHPRYRSNDIAYNLKRAMDYKNLIKELEAEYAAGDISRKEYETQLKNYQKEYNWYMKYYYTHLQVRRNNSAMRYQDDASRIQSNLNKYKALKRRIEIANDDLKSSQSKLDDIKANGEKSAEYSYAIKRIAELKDEIANAKNLLKSYEKQISSNSQAADMKNYLDRIDKTTNTINNAQAELDKLFKRDSK